MVNNLVEWQRVDPSNGLVEPWWTWNFMEYIKTIDFKNKKWLEFGAGLGTAWLRDKSNWVDSIEADEQWAARSQLYCQQNGKLNGYIASRQLADCISGVWEIYKTLIPKDEKYDVISIDGIYRTECIGWAIDHFKGRGGLMVIDNLDQDFVWISPLAMQLITPYESEVFIQPNHINHEGKPWNTRWVKIPA